METDPFHAPVLVNEVLGLLCPAGRRPPKTIMDCTLGLGGHARVLLEKAGTDTCLIGMDADKNNVIFSRKNLAPFGGQVRFFHANFSRATAVLAQAELERVDVLIADLGFSSNQMEDPAYGLSFRKELDGPLDMRFDRGQKKTAADIVNTYGREQLADLIYEYGEERFSRRIAAAIAAARKNDYIDRTHRLAEIIFSALPAAVRRGRNRIHPATRTFQALRIAVNGELDNLRGLLEALPRLIGGGGRGAIISFHSLEDRLVKRSFKRLVETNDAQILTKKPVTAGDQEASSNPRSRSAKLRAVEIG